MLSLKLIHKIDSCDVCMYVCMYVERLIDQSFIDLACRHVCIAAMYVHIRTYEESRTKRIHFLLKKKTIFLA
jgi:hypothetical protein